MSLVILASTKKWTIFAADKRGLHPTLDGSHTITENANKIYTIGKNACMGCAGVTLIRESTNPKDAEQNNRNRFVEKFLERDLHTLNLQTIANQFALHANKFLHPINSARRTYKEIDNLLNGVEEKFGNLIYNFSCLLGGYENNRFSLFDIVLPLSEGSLTQSFLDKDFNVRSIGVINQAATSNLEKALREVINPEKTTPEDAAKSIAKMIAAISIIDPLVGNLVDVAVLKPGEETEIYEASLTS